MKNDDFIHEYFSVEKMRNFLVELYYSFQIFDTFRTVRYQYCTVDGPGRNVIFLINYLRFLYYHYTFLEKVKLKKRNERTR